MQSACHANLFSQRAVKPAVCDPKFRIRDQRPQVLRSALRRECAALRAPNVAWHGDCRTAPSACTAV
jgi:hypothetical protein